MTEREKSARLEVLNGYLERYPASVVAVSYGGEPPPLVRLGGLLDRGTPEPEDPPLQRFLRGLRRVRGDLSEAALLDLMVPLGAGDQEVFAARLGKWLFEKRVLERELLAAERMLSAPPEAP